MSAYKIDYVFDGYPFYEIVDADTPELAIAYLRWLRPDYSRLTCSGVSSEIARFYCPSGWTEPETREQADQRGYEIFLYSYLGDDLAFQALHGRDSAALEDFLTSDGWVRSVGSDEEGFPVYKYKRYNMSIDLYSRK